jgi:hypothetical protein
MAKVKHIPRSRTFFTGRTVTQCGKKLRPDEVAPKGAPTCRACMRDAGWWTPRGR